MFNANIKEVKTVLKDSLDVFVEVYEDDLVRMTSDYRKLSVFICDMITDLSLNNYAEIIREVEKFLGDYTFTKKVIHSIYEVHSQKLAHDNSYIQAGLTECEIEALEDYISEGFEDINDYLLGETNINNIENVLKSIEYIDSAISKADLITTTLYRGQHFTIHEIEQIKKDGEFTFKNFVSTSYAPIIFGGWLGNSTSLYCENRYDENFAKAPLTCNVSWIIDCKESKGLIAGNLSWNKEECEVILPRGTTLKIKNVIESFGNESNRQFNIFAEIV